MEKKFNIDQVLQDAKEVMISGHVRPDGDCVGACTALWMYLKTYHPSVHPVICLQKIPETLGILKGTDEICHSPEGLEAPDLFFMLDCSGYDRLGEFAQLARDAKRRVCIDHHITATAIAEDNEIRPTASSTCEVLCELITPEKVTKQMAEALYLGIGHDTGFFRYSCTSSRTMQLAGMLMDKGIDFSKIAEDTYFSKTMLQKQILGKVLLESVSMLDGRVVFSGVRRKEFDFYKVTTSDLDGIVAELKNISGTDVSIFMYETGTMEWKVSLRSSPKVDVSLIAAHFGGGGHKQASGCNMNGTMFDVVNSLTEQIVMQLQPEGENQTD